MKEFRYEQFCPVARACEVLASRWTLLIIRDLFRGPQRFSDLKRVLPGISASVLTGRLTQLEGHGVIERRELPPPAASNVYALTPTGEALRPALLALVRWGFRFMGSTRAEDHLEPGWLPLGFEAAARRGESPKRCIEVRIPDSHGAIVVRVQGGREGTQILLETGPSQAWIEAEPRALLAFAFGALDPLHAVEAGSATAGGDLSALREFSELFEMNS